MFRPSLGHPYALKENIGLANLLNVCEITSIFRASTWGGA
jgi:hypothetical protein